MRFATIFIAVLGCASGGRKENAEVDAAPQGDGAPDAQTCGGEMQLPCDGIYVAKNGNDTGPGTQTAPVRTISAGLAHAQAMNKKTLFVKAGIYQEQVAMIGGVTVYGGFDDSWNRPGATAKTEIQGPSPTVKFESISNGSVIDNVTIKSDDAIGASASSIAVMVVASETIELRDVTIIAGAAASGADGVIGSNGASGQNGVVGNVGVSKDTGCGTGGNPFPTGGAGGFSACGMTGGTGGMPGVSTGAGSVGGEGLATAGFPNTMGGPGGPANTDGSAGFDGFTGFNGPGGTAGATVGTFANGTYVPASGLLGEAGGNGNGGGGGGGGGGSTNGSGSCPGGADTTGGSGGGGGGGGCAGTGGGGGGGGGGSFGMIVTNSMVVVRSSRITSGQGGAGGRGANGGTGGTGGAGRSGGAKAGTSGIGGGGGPGGAGGNGGAGGGGGGGPSAAVACSGTVSITVPQSILTPGVAGAGGASVGHPGNQGQAANALGCTFF